jgi:hypothetical protein
MLPPWMAAPPPPPGPPAAPLAPVPPAPPMPPPALANAMLPAAQPAAPPPQPMGPGPQFGMGPAQGAQGAPVDMGDVFADPIYDEFKQAQETGRGMFAPPPDAGMGVPQSSTPPMGNPMAGGPAPQMPGMGMGLGPMLDPGGVEAIQREQAFASMFPRALEAMNRTGLARGGSDSVFKPGAGGASSPGLATNQRLRGF